MWTVHITFFLHGAWQQLGVQHVHGARRLLQQPLVLGKCGCQLYESQLAAESAA